MFIETLDFRAQIGNFEHDSPGFQVSSSMKMFTQQTSTVHPGQSQLLHRFSLSRDKANTCASNLRLDLDASETRFLACSTDHCEYIGKSVLLVSELQKQLAAERDLLAEFRAVEIYQRMEIARNAVFILTRSLVDRDMVRPAANSARATAEINGWIAKNETDEEKEQAKMAIKRMQLRWHPGESDMWK